VAPVLTQPDTQAQQGSSTTVSATRARHSRGFATPGTLQAARSSTNACAAPLRGSGLGGTNDQAADALVALPAGWGASRRTGGRRALLRVSSGAIEKFSAPPAAAHAAAPPKRVGRGVASASRAAGSSATAGACAGHSTLRRSTVLTAAGVGR
jgi:hypothetical protein